MPDLLLELRSEEIPARMQRKAAGDLRKMITDGLVEAGLTYEGCKEYWTPRRLTLDIRGVTARSRDVHEERKGPSTKAPDQAIQGFLRAAGLSSIAEAHVHTDPKKGDFYVAHISKPGRAAEEIIAALVPGVIRTFPWPKEMRWGAASGPKGARYGKVEGRGSETLRWVRPLQSIVCTFGPETEEPVVVDFEVDGIRAGNVTYGHRFHAPGAITVRRFEDYAAKLEAAKVVVDADRRKEIILADARNLAFAGGLELVEDEALLEEVSGLVEWPVVLMGEFEQDFLEIPAEVIRLTIRANQKCFVVRPSRPASPAPQDEGGQHGGPHPEVRAERASKDALSNRFLLTANIEASDGGKEIAHGNGKVVRARLSDALYFWKTDQADVPDLGELKASAEKFGLDLKKPLDQRMARLDHLNVTFHAKLGTQGERVERIARLAEEIADTLSTSPLWGDRTEGAGGGDDLPPPLTPPHKGEGNLKALARRAAVLAKADLQTEVVGEFPELQGGMGRKYALLQGEHASVAAAIEEHYKPQGPSDRVPADPVSIAVALADKLDTLVGFWAIDEKPTGSKDPFALRRAALGVIRIVVENGVRAPLLRISRMAHWRHFVREAARLRAFDSAVEVVPLVNQVADWGNLYKTIVVADQFEDEKRFAAQLAHFNETFFRRRPFVVAWALGETTGNAVPEIPSAYMQFERENTLDLLSFFHDRLKVYLRDQGARHDLIDAVLASGGNAPTSPLRGGRAEGAGGGDDEHNTPTPALRADPPLKGEGGDGGSNDDLLTIVRRVEALGKFLDSDDGKNLLAGTKRAANILAAEEKKGTVVAEAVDAGLFKEEAEKKLFAAVNQAESQAGQAIQNEDFSAALAALSALREPVDSFFEEVLVNDEDAAVRANRLALLSRIRAATGQVADFSKIAG